MEQNFNLAIDKPPTPTKMLINEFIQKKKKESRVSLKKYLIKHLF